MPAIKQTLFLLLTRLGIILVSMAILRIFFTLYNHVYFDLWGWIELIKGLRIDLSYSIYVFSLYFFTQIIFPNKLKTIKLALFLLGFMLVIIPELIDWGYFSFVQKRLTKDVLIYLRPNGEFWALAPKFIWDYKWSLLSFIILLFSVKHFFTKVEKTLAPTSWVQKIGISIVWITFTIIAGRGGLQHRPLELANAVKGVSPQNIPIVLNSGFSLFSSFFVGGVQPVHYMSTDEAQSYFSPQKHSKKDTNTHFKPNIVILILESFSQEYIGYYNHSSNSYTPFLDSLLKKSITYKRAYANGKRSVEAVPAILAGLPSLMSDPYIFSSYATNSIRALPSILKEYGYNTSFYHGGHNGTMGFDGFCTAAGIDDYYGYNEYTGDKKKDFDGNWGIFDEPYLQYFAKDLSQKKEPFFSSLFTLSSHHPYTIPHQHKGKFKKGTLDIHQSVRYADYSLQQFFKNASKKSWFKNTIFILTADHTAQASSHEYGNIEGKYRIPLAIYNPTNLKIKLNTNQITQQSDIMAIALTILGKENNYLSFGNNLGQEENWAVMYNDNKVQLITKQHVIQIDYEGKHQTFKLKKDGRLKKVEGQEKDIQILKSIMQQYTSALIKNQLK